MLYRRKKHDEHSDKTTGKLGWETNTGTRNILLDEFESMIRKGFVYEVDDREVKELTTYVKINGKKQASPPHHDDAIMADAICCQMFKYPSYTF